MRNDTTVLLTKPNRPRSGFAKFDYTRALIEPSSTAELAIENSVWITLLDDERIDHGLSTQVMPSFRTAVFAGWHGLICDRPEMNALFPETGTWLNALYKVVARTKEDVSVKFERLANHWLVETQHCSDISEIISHPSYQQIIGMGPFAISPILNRLEHEGAHWFAALKAITGIDPVPEDDAGRVQKMRMHWLNWGKTNGYLVS